VVDQSFLEASYEGTVASSNRNMLRNSDGHLIAMGRNDGGPFEDEKGTERATQRVAYGSKIYGRRRRQGETRPASGRVGPVYPPDHDRSRRHSEFEDLVDGLSVQESADESTGITKRQVIDWRSTPRGADLKPAIVLKGKGRDRQAGQWRRSPLPAVGRRDPVGRAGRAWSSRVT
jgi:DNA-directed RNA polymerase subunit beta'